MKDRHRLWDRQRDKIRHSRVRHEFSTRKALFVRVKILFWSYASGIILYT